MSNTEKAVICGFYGHSNLGDEAMLAGMVNVLREYKENLSITVFSNDPQDTEIRHSVQAIDRSDPTLKFQRNLKILQSRYFILGGGDLLRDSITDSIASVWLQYLQRALQLRRRTLVLGVSVGEIWRPETRSIIPKVLNQVDLIAVRDKHSKAKLEKLGVNNPIYVISDLALKTVPAVTPHYVENRNQPLQIGISVRHLSNRGFSTDVDRYPSLIKEVAAVADFLVERYSATVHFLPFLSYPEGYHSSDDDYISTMNVLRYSRYSSQVIVHRHFQSLQDLNQEIASLDLMIGMRLHSLILSTGMGVPVIALEYDSKVKGFMEEISQSEFSVPIASFNKERLVPLIEKILSDRASAHERVVEGVKHYLQQASPSFQALKQVLR